MTEIPYGYCQCGCGNRTKLAIQDEPGGVRKGEPRKYLLNHAKRRKGPDYLANPETGCWVWQHNKTSGGYGKYFLNGRYVVAHRLVWERERGAVPEGLELDHICRNRACVNPAHLRLATREQNQHNRVVNRNNTSGARNVYAEGARWRVIVTCDHVRHDLGLYDSVEEASAAATAFRREHMPFSEMDRAA